MFADGRSVEPSDTLYEGSTVNLAVSPDPVALATVRLELRELVAGSIFFPVGQCSGTLITPDVVLTAGHCLVTFKNSKATAQLAIIYSLKSGGSATVIMKDYAIFPDYDQSQSAKARGNDLALVRLRSAVKDRQPVPLAGPDDFQDGSPVTVAGYGENGKNGDLDSGLTSDPQEKALNEAAQNQPVTESGRKQTLVLIAKAAQRAQDYLRENSPLLETKMTAMMARGTPLGDVLRIESSDSSICEGDSGGPSVLTVNGRLALVGVHSGSNNDKCAPSSGFFWSTHYLNVDVFVPTFSAWIKSQVKTWGEAIDI